VSRSSRINGVHSPLMRTWETTSKCNEVQRFSPLEGQGPASNVCECYRHPEFDAYTKNIMHSLPKILFRHNHAPLMGYHTRLNAHEMLPQRARDGPHTILARGNMHVMTKIPYPIHRANHSRRPCKHKNALVQECICSKGGWDRSPVPNSSTIFPLSDADLTSFIVTGRSETVSLAGSPGTGALPDAWSRASASTESRVTPGKIIPSSGGVTSSTAAKGELQ
jgi:hypothetical protein